jgi:CRISPR-associated protein Cas1
MQSRSFNDIRHFPLKYFLVLAFIVAGFVVLHSSSIQMVLSMSCKSVFLKKGDLLPMEESTSKGVPDLIPARMLNEWAYCPRLCYIEWVTGEFLDSADTVDGRFQHRRVDSGTGKIPSEKSGGSEPEEEHEAFHARSVYLSGPACGFTCRIDLLEGVADNLEDGTRAKSGKIVIPIDYKRGKAPEIPGGIYEPDMVQLCAQGLILRENGFSCDRGIAYFVRSKKKVDVIFDDSLIERTMQLAADLRTAAGNGKLPPPLVDSPKCPRCSLAGICLPDEVNLLLQMEKKVEGWERMREAEDASGTARLAGLSPVVADKVRPLFAARDDQVPVYVSGQGNTVRKNGERIEVWSRDGVKASSVRMMDISQLSLYGGVEITTPAMVELMGRGIPVIHFTHGGWFQGICIGNTHKNVELRLRQYDWATNPRKAVLLARSIVAGKIRNCRVLLRRNDPELPDAVLKGMAEMANAAEKASSLESLLGIEGSAAEKYFGRFGSLFKSAAGDGVSDGGGNSFENRNRRPPRDPINAVLSYLYGILVKDLTVTLLAVGFDPFLGFYHQPRYGRPALALDMMEEFRPLIADSTAITLFNKGELSGRDFIKTGIGVTLKPEAKKTVLGGYERRMSTEVTHPIFGYQVSYRRVLEIQARLLSRVLSGEISEYPVFVTR